MENIKLEVVTKVIRSNQTQKEEKSIPVDHRKNKNGNDDILGMPISKKLAIELIKNYDWSKESKEEEKIISVTFDASALLLLLSQKGCAGIRYYYAMKPNEEETMVLIGIDANGNDLGVPIPQNKNGKKSSIKNDTKDDSERSIVLEVGGGNKESDFV